MKILYNQLIAGLKKNADPRKAKSDLRWHKYDTYKAYGLSAPQLRGVLRQFKLNIRALSEKEVFSLAEKLYSSKIEEEVLAGNYILEIRNNLPESQTLIFLDRVLDYFGSWSTIDDLCIDVLQPILRRYSAAAIPWLKKWNKSENMWKRRASLVVFTRKVGESGQFTDLVLKLCDRLVWDKEDLVQKAVGWVLKDNLRGNRPKVLKYIKKLRATGASSTIVLYAIRDLNQKERQAILGSKYGQ